MPIAVRIPLPIGAEAADDPAERPILEAFEDFEPLIFDLGLSEAGPFEEPPQPADDPAERIVTDAAVAEPEPDDAGLFEPFAFDEIDDGIGVAQAVELAAIDDEPGFSEPGPHDLILNDLSEIVAAAAVPDDEDEPQPGYFEALRDEPPAADDIVLPPELVELIAAEDEPGYAEPGPFEEPPAPDDVFAAADIFEPPEPDADGGLFEPGPFEAPPEPQVFGIVPPGLLAHWRRLRRREEARRGKPAVAAVETESPEAEPQRSDRSGAAPQRRKPPQPIDPDRRIERKLRDIRTLDELRQLTLAAQGLERRLLLELLRGQEMALRRQRDEDDAIAILLMD